MFDKLCFVSSLVCVLHSCNAYRNGRPGNVYYVRAMYAGMDGLVMCITFVQCVQEWTAW